MTAKEKAKLVVNRITSWAPWNSWYDVSRAEIEGKIEVGLQEYAKEQAIAFAIENAQRKLTWLKSLRQAPDPESVENDRMEERYLQFIKQQADSK